eukprot:CAMPEP_0117579094 /NCGR_PEP_ID=MMETSP0784-20121206/64412_1 /TAXON_ID=39447 /ORGANISM="" /LENGTH=85 /DNA_ID=CAMNT_0005378919 /DNA_START=1 /DNA_END=255 /DNA_ORIENTATION=+
MLHRTHTAIAATAGRAPNCLSASPMASTNGCDTRCRLEDHWWGRLSSEVGARSRRLRDPVSGSQGPKATHFPPLAALVKAAASTR